MAITKNVEISGSSVVSTNNGTIEINKNTGALVIRKDGRVLTKVDSSGFTYSETNGTRRIFMGSHPVDGRIVQALSKPGVDVIEELKK